MNARRTAFPRVARAFMVVLLVFALVLVFVPASLAGESASVTVSATIGSCIGVANDGTLIGNVSALSFEGSGFLSILAR